MKWFGYTGNIGRVDLANREFSVEQADIKDVKNFIGGFGMNCRLGADLIKPNIDPLSPDNPIIIGTGPLVGTIMPGASRTVALTKFPASGAIANSCGSMSFGFHLKQSGFDHLIITGKADKPSYLLISEGIIEVRDAGSLWGKDIVEATESLWKSHEDCGVIAIGQAGEHLVKSSLTLIDKTSTLGRGGLGAVMGSKNLKAIVARGTLGISIAEPKAFNKIYSAFFERIREYPQRASWHKLGMLRSLPIGMLLAAKGQKKKARECSERTYLKKIKKRRMACPSCPMADKDVLELCEGPNEGLIHYTSSVINPFLMLTLKDLNTHHEAIKIFDQINRYGLDSLTITSLFELMTNLYERGVISKDDMGIEWKSDFQTMMKVIKMITFREGFGDIIADGWKKLAEINETLAEEMLVIKGLDVVFDPRFMRLGTMEFEQVVNIKGAHVASGGSPTYATSGGSTERFKTHFHRMGIPESAFDRIFAPPFKEMVINVPRLTRYSEDWYTILTNLGLCARAQMNRFYSLELVTKFYNVMTGIELEAEELRKSAERSWNLLKIMNAREGFGKKDDLMPKEWFKALKYGDNELVLQDFFATTKISTDIAEQFLWDYYNERGWDETTGLPSRDKLRELGLESYL